MPSIIDREISRHRVVGVLLFLALPEMQALAEEPRYESTVTLPVPSDLPSGQAQSRVTLLEMQERLPRSAPDALRYEPGVFVQQTAHGQGSAYIRGLTGQQTLLMFDGIRLNNSTYRQGPNQYFFTLDSHTISSIEVQRGGASTQFGSDALGGVLAAHPIEPIPMGAKSWRVDPRIMGRFATADKEYGGRAQLGFSVQPKRGPNIGFVGGVGGRNVGLLESAGGVQNPDPTTPIGPLPWVPRFQEDGRTQLGTGFKELTADGRLVLRFDRKNMLTVAAYLYREYDAPRTDNCPAPTAPYNTCLIYEEQFRHLAYVTYNGSWGRAAEKVRVSLSWQQQHERRNLNRPDQFTQNLGVDDVDTLGLVVRLETHRFTRRWFGLMLSYGLDNYVDFLRSSARLRYTDVKIDSPLSRGQYLDGSRYVQGGSYADLELGFGPRVTLRTGARVSWAWANAPGDPQSGSRAIHRSWAPLSAHAGLEWKIHRRVAALVAVDHSFRAPNLDDLTSRQQTGPGFQFENANLRPEKATTFEAGLQVRHEIFSVDVWAFETLLQDTVLKSPRDADACPADTPQCNGSWSKIQLVNAPSLSELRGFEGAARLRFSGLTLSTTISYAWGEGPRVGALPAGLNVMQQDRVPLSRVPPLNGTVEIRYAHRWGFAVGGALRWAAQQDRLALADYSDGRIPKYGTPGFAVVDLRASYRWRRRIIASVVVENVFDSPYRYHGSSINGAGRGGIFQLEGGLD